MSEDDPFESLEDEVEDREGDPFEQLNDAVDEPADSTAEDADETASPEPDHEQSAGGSWVDEYGVENTGVAGGESTTSESDARSQPPEDSDAQSGASSESEASEEPSEMSFDVGVRDSTVQPEPLTDASQREGDPFSEMGDAFEEMESEGVDPDVVWQELTSAQSSGSISDSQGRTYADVSKHSYCETCEHFSGPPEIQCTHEGTEILEFLDMETVRVVDCPVVAERREIERNE